jgi:hypothetical protein
LFFLLLGSLDTGWLPAPALTLERRDVNTAKKNCCWWLQLRAPETVDGKRITVPNMTAARDHSCIDAPLGRCKPAGYPMAFRRDTSKSFESTTRSQQCVY